MESLDFPDNPGLNETWPAPNGITYQWDGSKWDVFVRPDDNVNYWARNAATEKLSPRNFDDNLVISNLAVDLFETLPSV